MKWFTKGEQCPAEAATRSADALFRRRGGSHGIAEQHGQGQPSKSDAAAHGSYQPLGPLCSIIARKFGGETVDAVLANGANCTAGYGWARNCLMT